MGEAADFVDDVPRLHVTIGQIAHDDLRPLVIHRAQFPIEAFLVGLDHAIGGFHDALRRPVVDLEIDARGIREILLEIEDVPDVRLPPRVDRLVGITHHEKVAVPFRECGDEDVLDAVGVLVFVDHDVAEPLLVGLEHRRCLVEHFERLAEEVVEIDGIGLGEDALVGLVHPSDHLVVVGHRLCAEFLRGKEHRFRRGDAREGATGCQLFRIEPDGDDRLLHCLLLVRIVIDQEVGEDAETIGDKTRVLPEHTHAETVEGAHHHAGDVGAMKQTFDAIPHLAGGFVRERDCEDLFGPDAAFLNQPGDAVHQDAGLARPRPSDDENRAFGGDDSALLLGVQPDEQGMSGISGHGHAGLRDQAGEDASLAPVRAGGQGVER